MKNLDILTVNTIRALSVDMVEKANSGHPGMPLGAAPIAYNVWGKHLNFSLNNKKWMNRDRFVLSAGHASALLYSLLHLFGYDVSIDDLKQFRQLYSITPGHPEYGMTDGVEATTGPLGAGLTMAVGMAMAQSHLAATFNQENYEVFNNYTFVLSGDGCMMEGITSEASSLAGHLNLGRLIVIYDSNNTTIEGNTNLAFSENVRKRYEAYGFETFLVEDGNNLDAINDAINMAKSNLERPSFIEVRTKIGYGSAKEGTSGVHGSPLGKDNIVKLKEFMNYPVEDFYVAPEVYEYCNNLVSDKEVYYDKWVKMYEDYQVKFPELAKQLQSFNQDIELEDVLKIKELFEFDGKPLSTRNASGMLINKLNSYYPNLFGGSADLAPSNMTNMKEEASYSPNDYSGKNIHFGVREHAMAAIGNGIVLYGGLKSYVATFFVFADFLKPMFRLSSLMKLPLTYVLTHDSIGVGEDGPTHEPVEQLVMLRSTPNSYTFRPADGKETAYGWALALSSKDKPVSLILSRQNLPYLEQSNENALKGGYVVYDHQDPKMVILATGSEVSLAIDAANKLNEEGIGVRVVSVPCLELFQEQPLEYQNEVLLTSTPRMVIEAGSKYSWGELVKDGIYLTIDTFGESGPANKLFEHFGFTVDNVVAKVKSRI